MSAMYLLTILTLETVCGFLGCECSTYPDGQIEILTKCDYSHNVQYHCCYW